jgi:hypothetical protein
MMVEWSGNSTFRLTAAASCRPIPCPALPPMPFNPSAHPHATQATPHHYQHHHDTDSDTDSDTVVHHHHDDDDADNDNDARHI